jgi:hypothetical protein
MSNDERFESVLTVSYFSAVISYDIYGKKVVLLNLQAFDFNIHIVGSKIFFNAYRTEKIWGDYISYKLVVINNYSLFCFQFLDKYLYTL